MSRKYSVLGSFRFALAGIKEALTNEPNFQIHTIIGITALLAGFIVHLSKVEWIVLLFTVAFVLILELFNTAVEAIVDHLSPKVHPKAKVAKDVSAAAVFIAALLAAVVGAILFVPKLLPL